MTLKKSKCFEEVGHKRKAAQPRFHGCLKLAYQGAILETLVIGKDLLTLGSSWNVIMVSSLFFFSFIQRPTPSAAVWPVASAQVWQRDVKLL